MGYSKAIDPSDYGKIKKTVTNAGYDVDEALRALLGWTEQDNPAPPDRADPVCESGNRSEICQPFASKLRC